MSPRSTSSQSGGSRRKRRSRGRKILVRGLWTIFGLVVVLAVAIAVLFWKIQIPTPNQFAQAQATILYYADGRTELGRISAAGGNRVSVALTAVPIQTRHAVLAAEDRSFYTNGGVSLTGTARAILNDIRGGSTQGGSTITQQYVKNYFLTQDQTLSRKVREAVISVKLDRRTSKDTILQDYLNTIYFGRGAYGIQTASQTYYGKDVSQLDLSQSAFLASVLNAPSLYDPAGGAANLARAKLRFTYVLDGMQQEGWITQAQRSAAKFPKLLALNQKSSVSGPLGYVVADVRAELRDKLKLTADQIDQGGLRITTTIDRGAEDAAIAAVDKNQPTGANTSHIRTGLTAIKPGDGAVVAMYGGPDYAKSQFSAATDAHMQAGSTFKPFTLIAALQNGIPTSTRFPGYTPHDFPSFVTSTNPRGAVTNFDNEQFGTIDLLTATEYSVNTVFVQLNLQVGAAKTEQAAISAGLPPKTPGLQPNPANVLGTASPRVIDMANAYATIAARGQRATPYLIESVTSTRSSLHFTAKPQVQRAFTKDVADNATAAMERVVQGGTGEDARALGRPAAGKTGTTNENLAVWFDGFTPQLAAAVGLYNDVNGTPKPLQNIDGINAVTGGTFPVKIWTAFMQGALNGEMVENFAAPSSGGSTSSVSAAPTQTSTAPSPTSTFSSPSPTSSAPPSSTSSTSSTSSSTGTPTPTSTSTVPPTSSSTSSTSPTTSSSSTTSPTTSRTTASSSTTSTTSPAKPGVSAAQPPTPTAQHVAQLTQAQLTQAQLTHARSAGAQAADLADTAGRAASSALAR